MTDDIDSKKIEDKIAKTPTNVLKPDLGKDTKVEININETISEITESNSELIRLISFNKQSIVWNFLDKCKDQFDINMARILIQAGHTALVILYLQKFEKSEHKKIALELIEAGDTISLGWHLDKFEGLDHEMAIKLIEAGQEYSVAKYLDKFERLNHREIALLLIKSGKDQYVAENLDKFEGLDHEIAIKLIEAGQGLNVAENLDKFEGLDHEMAIKLIEAGQGLNVTENPDKFEGLDDREVKAKIVEVVHEMVAPYDCVEFQNLDDTVHFDYTHLVKTLIQAGLWLYIEENLDELKLEYEFYKFTGYGLVDYDFQNDNASFSISLNKKELALFIMRRGSGLSTDRASNSDFIIKYNNNKLAKQLIKAGLKWFAEFNSEENNSQD